MKMKCFSHEANFSLFCDEFFIVQLKPLSCHFNWCMNIYWCIEGKKVLRVFALLFKMKFNDDVVHRLKLFKYHKKERIEKVVLIMATRDVSSYINLLPEALKHVPAERLCSYSSIHFQRFPWDKMFHSSNFSWRFRENIKKL